VSIIVPPTPYCECDAFSICFFFFFLIKLKIKLPGACGLYRVEQLQLDCNLLFARMNAFKFVIGQEIAVMLMKIEGHQQTAIDGKFCKGFSVKISAFTITNFCCC
jgi:hypothetical protein